MNPRKKPNGKELCDALLVCEPDVIVFSIQQIRLANSGHPEVDAERWRKRAVDESCKQIYGAERILKQSKCVIRNDSSVGLALPKAAEVKIHRVAVALGGKRKVGLPFGEFGKGSVFVNAIDEVSFLTLLKELDTISGFVPYLAAKEG